MKYVFDIFLSFDQYVDFSGSNVDPYIEATEATTIAFQKMVDEIAEIALEMIDAKIDVTYANVDLSEDDDYPDSTASEFYHFTTLEHTIGFRYTATEDEVELGPRRRNHYSLTQDALIRLREIWIDHFDSMAFYTEHPETKALVANPPFIYPEIKIYSYPARRLKRGNFSLSKTAKSHLDIDEKPTLIVGPYNETSWSDMARSVKADLGLTESEA